MFERDRSRYEGDTGGVSELFTRQGAGPEMTRSLHEQQRLRGAGRRDPLAHQLSFSSESSLDEAGYEQIKRIPVPAPASIFSSGGTGTTGTSVNPSPSPARLLPSARPFSQDNVDYRKIPRQANVTLELPASGLAVEPAPSPCPSPIIFRGIKEESEDDDRVKSLVVRRSQSKSPRPRCRPEESRQPGHVSSTDEPESPSRATPKVIGNVPLIKVMGSSPDKSELHHSPESAFRKPIKDKPPLEIAKERRRLRRSQSRSPSPLVIRSFRTEDPEPITIGFRPISPTSDPSATRPGPTFPPVLTSSFSDATVLRPVASPAVVESSLPDTFPASHESRVQQMKVLIHGLLRMVFHTFGCFKSLCCCSVEINP